MKNLTTILLIAITITTQAQTGINFGINNSWFAGGFKKLQGINLATVGVKAGIYHYIPITKRFDLLCELNYLALGQKNPAENKTNFKTYHINIPVLLVYRIGYFNINAGMYGNKLLYARNYSWPGPTFGWKTAKWDYYRQYNYGFVGGVGVDLIGATLETRFLYSFLNVRDVSYNDPKLWRSHDEAISVTLNIPFKTFTE